MDQKSIEDFVEKMNYWQRVNIVMSDEYLDNPELGRAEAYEKALDVAHDDKEVVFSLKKNYEFWFVFALTSSTLPPNERCPFCCKI